MPRGFKNVLANCVWILMCVGLCVGAATLPTRYEHASTKGSEPARVTIERKTVPVQAPTLPVAEPRSDDEATTGNDLKTANYQLPEQPDFVRFAWAEGDHLPDKR